MVTRTGPGCGKVKEVTAGVWGFSPSSPRTVRDSLLLMAVRVNDSLELEVTGPKEHKGDVEQEEG